MNLHIISIPKHILVLIIIPSISFSNCVGNKCTNIKNKGILPRTYFTDVNISTVLNIGPFNIANLDFNFSTIGLKSLIFKEFWLRGKPRYFIGKVLILHLKVVEASTRKPTYSHKPTKDVALVALLLDP